MRAADPELASSAFVSPTGGVVEHPMTPEDVAVLLQINRETVYRMARHGELPAFKVSSRWRFLPSRLAALDGRARRTGSLALAGRPLVPGRDRGIRQP